MKLKAILMLAVLVLAAASTQAGIASKHGHTRKTACVASFNQLRNSNAYAASAAQSYASDYAEGALTSGLAGH